MLRIALMLIMLFFSASSRANSLDTAFVHLMEKQYAQAIAISQQLLDDLKLNTINEISLAHKILGTAYCHIGSDQKALDHYKTLKTFSPNASLAGIEVSPKCQKIFTHLNIQPSTQTQNKKTKRSPRKNDPPINTTEQAQLTPSVNAPFNRYIPFGVGQFHNKNKPRGLAFLITQSLLYSTGATFLAMHSSSSNQDLRDAGFGMIASGGFVSIWGILDAVRTYRREN